ncbi:hypothetical protein ABCR94_18930 [Streptomyces sp. 21So2-11]
MTATPKDLGPQPQPAPDPALTFRPMAAVFTKAGHPVIQERIHVV